jgi:hypothetical protein
MSTTISAALMMYGIAAVISMFVAVMIKALYWALQFMQRKDKKK